MFLNIYLGMNSGKMGMNGSFLRHLALFDFPNTTTETRMK